MTLPAIATVAQPPAGASDAPSWYGDAAGLRALRNGASQAPEQALREAARQFESLFTRMLLQSMRAASMGEELGESEQTEFYQEMFDQQLSVELARGDGLGLAKQLVEQLLRSGMQGAAVPAAAEPAPATTTAPANDGTQSLDRQAFIRSLLPAVEPVAQALGVSVDTIIAHAALETGWGAHRPRSAPGAEGFNLFGIKAGDGWRGARTHNQTTEVSEGVARRLEQPFRAYGSVDAALADYANLVSGSSRYAGALGAGEDAHAYASALKRGGYATDPDYVAKLTATAASVRALRAEADFSTTTTRPITTSHHG